ncbi:uncharacterized protein LOC111865077 isoform X2 [Cryptotermes secundus]|uniref:uncharacterized protein LOC111865077 isoform X2 n=1 Tax=Cryptotermes secundus TaxID=105785 RepID=UPI001454CBDF|nr:uncharacterized protein LOC111865077 isoform X2 [Cryptotermes secundus]
MHIVLPLPLKCWQCIHHQQQPPTFAAKETSLPLSPEYINACDWEPRHINHCSMSQCSSGYSVPNSCEHSNLAVYDADEDGCMMWSQDVSGSGPEVPGHLCLN